MAKKSIKPLLYILITCVFCFIINHTSYAQTVEVTLPDTTGVEGSTISIPVRCNDVTALGVYAYGLKVAYDQNIITATGVTVEEAISLPWGTPTFNVEDGVIIVAAAGSEPLSGEGILFFVNFIINGAVGNNSIIQFADVLFNEGDPIAVTSDGNLEIIPPTSIKSEPLIPKSFNISPAYPNPFNPSTTVEFELTARSRISVNVYDELGRFINSLADEYLDMGRHYVTWDGYDQSHREVSSGIYFIRISTGKKITTITTLKVVKLN